jgi:hypothetical protein
MAKTEPKKRKLKFAGFTEMLNEIESLSKGYVSNGNWTLGQTCAHIGEWMRYPLDGFPKPPFFIKPFFWIMKVTMGASMKRKIMAEGFSGGMPTAPQSVPEQDAQTDAEAIEALQKTIARVKAHQGEFIPSPLFGPMDKETLLKVTLLHAEHHLGYLEAK